MKEGQLSFYPKISSSGLAKPWNAGWYIEEKIDGSQLSFCRQEITGVIFFNRGRPLEPPYGVFQEAVFALQKITAGIPLNTVFHGETVTKLRHNVVRYGRLPRFFFVLFDVQNPDGSFASRAEVESYASQLNLECVQLLHAPCADLSIQPQHVIPQLSTVSMLGGDAAEGVVVKHPAFDKGHGHTSARKVKVVRKEFKEQHKAKKDKLEGLSANEKLALIASWFPAEPRLRKAQQRLRDQGKEDASWHDVLNEAKRDLEAECGDQLKDLLWACFGQELVKMCIKQ